MTLYANNINIETLTENNDRGSIINYGKFYLTKGKVTAKTPASIMYHGLYNIGTMTIGAEASLKLESGLINEREGHITNNGRLETAGYTYLTAPSLIENNGEWILNGNVDSQDTEWDTVLIRVGENGTIRGDGDIIVFKPDSGFEALSSNQTTTWISKIDLSQFFKNPKEQHVEYELTGDNNPAGARIEGDKLIVDKSSEERTCTIKATAAQTNFWSEKSVTITVTVRPEALQGVTITPYRGTYDGTAHKMVEISGVSKNAKIEYLVCYWNGIVSTNRNDLTREGWTPTCPTITNVSDAPPVNADTDAYHYGKRLYIRIWDNNQYYETQAEENIILEDTSYLKVEVYPRDLSDQYVEATVESPGYMEDDKQDGYCTRNPYYKNKMKKLVTVKYKGENLDPILWTTSALTPRDGQQLYNNSYYIEIGNYNLTLQA